MNAKASLSVFMMAMICFATTENISNIPLNAMYGLSAVFYLCFAFIFFFIPLSLVSAELATTWPNGGIYCWVKEAFGPSFGFLAIWLQWVQNIVWFPSVLIYIASTIAFLFHPELANDKVYLFSMFMGVFWLVTVLNFFGAHVSGLVTTLCTILGSMVPVILIIVMGGMWICMRQPIQIPLTWGAFFPDLSALSNITLLSGLILTIGGMEMSASYAIDMKSPQKNYPKAVLIASGLILITYSLGALSLAFVIPASEIGLGSGAIHAFHVFFAHFHMPWMTKIMAVFMTLGSLGMLNNWVLGPAKGMLSAARAGELPSLFAVTNKKEVPIGILVIQGVAGNLIALMILFEPTINASYWMFYVLTAILYFCMYLLLFTAAIKLRYTMQHVHRPFQVPLGKKGVWFFSLLGFFASLFAIIISFIPPSQVTTKSVLSYEMFLVGGIVTLALIPLLVYLFVKKKPKFSEMRRFEHG